MICYAVSCFIIGGWMFVRFVILSAGLARENQEITGILYLSASVALIMLPFAVAEILSLRKQLEEARRAPSGH